MSLRIDEPVIPPEIQQKIRILNRTLDNAGALFREINDWYDSEIKSYCPTCSADMELFDPKAGISVSQLSESDMMESLNELQTENVTKTEIARIMKDRDTQE